MGLKKDFIDFAEYMVPVTGDVKFYRDNRKLGGSALEKIASAAAFYLVKYAAIGFAAGYTSSVIMPKIYEIQRINSILNGC